MCLVIPLKVKTKNVPSLKAMAACDEKRPVAQSYGGVRRKTYLMEDGREVRSLVKNIKVGDYLICQQDLGIEKVSKNKVQLIRDALRQGM